MNQTTNYNFNVPVGSDIVNPLVQDFPNWESLDSILRNVANTGITTATHTKSGTIHTLSFTETTVPMIRFQATADFNTNDTFTVNGVSVSALTVSGQALPQDAFVIGSMVLCELRDNLLTVYTSGTDANTLQGHPASYFATASGLQTVDNKADANKVLIDQLTLNLSAGVNPVNITVTFGSGLFTNTITFCRKIGKAIFYNIRFRTGNVVFQAGVPFALLSHPSSDLIADQTQTSMAQNGLMFIGLGGVASVYTTTFTEDTRIGIASPLDLQANTDISVFGFIMLKG